jgi:hypothetical protein
MGAQDSTNAKVVWWPRELRCLRCSSARDASDLEDRWDATCTDRRFGGAGAGGGGSAAVRGWAAIAIARRNAVASSSSAVERPSLGCDRAQV